LTKIKSVTYILQREGVKSPKRERERERGCWCKSRNRSNIPPTPPSLIIHKPTTHHHFISNRVIQIHLTKLTRKKERRLKPFKPDIACHKVLSHKWNMIIIHPQTNWQRKGWWWWFFFVYISKLGKLQQLLLLLQLLPYHFNNLHYHYCILPKWWENMKKVKKLEFAWMWD
jgi:hypothetical protein